VQSISQLTVQATAQAQLTPIPVMSGSAGIPVHVLLLIGVGISGRGLGNSVLSRLGGRRHLSTLDIQG
jgi:hypothetical protein